MKLTKTTNNETQTAIFGKEVLADILSRWSADIPLIFCLDGELGSGKTRFVNGMGKALDLNINRSPTFSIMRRFAIKKTLPAEKAAGKELFFHIDCYRLSNKEEAIGIGFDKISRDPKVIVVIEWAERIKEIISKPYFNVKFEHIDKDKRKITVEEIKNEKY